jgi:hypothetical protein
MAIGAATLSRAITITLMGSGALGNAASIVLNVGSNGLERPWLALGLPSWHPRRLAAPPWSFEACSVSKPARCQLS